MGFKNSYLNGSVRANEVGHCFQNLQCNKIMFGIILTNPLDQCKGKLRYFEAWSNLVGIKIFL